MPEDCYNGPAYSLHLNIHNIHLINKKSSKFLKNMTGKIYLAVKNDLSTVSHCITSRSICKHKIHYGRSIRLNIYDETSEIYFKIFVKCVDGTMKRIANGSVNMKHILKDFCRWHIPLTHDNGKLTCLLHTSISTHSLHLKNKNASMKYHAPIDGSMVNEVAESMLNFAKPLKEHIRQTSIDIFMLPVNLISFLAQQAKSIVPPQNPLGISFIYNDEEIGQENII